MKLKLKILMLGPPKSGKTAIANFLSEAVANPLESKYSPTTGVRILEFEANSGDLGNRRVSSAKHDTPVEVELWDVGGDHKYEGCWPAIVQDAVGLVYVYDPNTSNHRSELERFANFFGKNIRPNQCLVMSHYKSGTAKSSGALPDALRDVASVQTSLDDDNDADLRSEFDAYAARLAQIVSSRREQDELNILAADR